MKHVYRFEDGSEVVADVRFNPDRATRVLARAIKSALRRPKGKHRGTALDKSVVITVESMNEQAHKRFAHLKKFYSCSHAGD